jgi:hypothetical protein
MAKIIPIGYEDREHYLATIFNCMRAGRFRNLDYLRKPYLKILTNSSARVCIVC